MWQWELCLLSLQLTTPPLMPQPVMLVPLQHVIPTLPAKLMLLSLRMLLQLLLATNLINQAGLLVPLLLPPLPPASSNSMPLSAE